MALQKDQLLQNGLIVKDAYIRIDSVSGYKGNITITVNSYTSQQSFLDNLPYVEQKSYEFVPDVSVNSKNIFEQGYEYLKTLPEFEDAIDC